MRVNKINEEVEYYVIDSKENYDSFLLNENGDIIGVIIPPSITPLRADYIFAYVNDLRAHPDHDYNIEEGKLRFKRSRSGDHVVIKLYTKHEASKEPMDIMT